MVCVCVGVRAWGVSVLHSAIRLYLLSSFQPRTSRIVWGHLSFDGLCVYKPSVTKAVKRSGGVVLMIALKSQNCEKRTQ